MFDFGARGPEFDPRLRQFGTVTMAPENGTPVRPGKAVKVGDRPLIDLREGNEGKVGLGQGGPEPNGAGCLVLGDEQ